MSIISFFNDWNHSVWADYSTHPDCIHVEEIDFNIDTQEPVLIEKKWKFSVKIVEKSTEIPEKSSISE